MGARRGQRGFTMVNVAVALVLLPILLQVLGRTFVSSKDLTESSRTMLRAQEDLRRNLEAVANSVRDADLDTLGGFDEDGSSRHPTYRQVVGADATGRLHTGPLELRWKASAGAVNGVDAPGSVVRVNGGEETLVAARVPSDGFRVELDGATLVIHLTTYYSLNADRVGLVHGRTAVALRN